MKETFWEITKVLVVHTLVTLLIFAAAITILVFFLRPRMRKYKPSDMKVFDRLSGITGPRASRFMSFITFLGNHLFLVPANLAVLFYFLFIRKQNWFSIRVAVVALSSLALMLLLKALFRRKRPLAPLLKAVRGLSFPSGHAIMSLTFYGLLIYIIGYEVELPWLRYLLEGFLIILIGLIGFSRIYLRVHYASDVLAGFIIGAIWLFISLNVLDKIERSLAN